MRLTLEEYSKHFKMSKEMINSKLRSRRLNYIIENGVTYIIVTRNSVQSDKVTSIQEKREQESLQEETTQAKENPSKEDLSKPKTTVAMVLGLYKKENKQLKDKIIQLEAKIDKLIDDKEQMLRDEMAKIEQVYENKDAQLKNVLELISAQMQTQSTLTHEVQEIHQVEIQEKSQEIVELKEYLKSLDMDSKERKSIKKRFAIEYGKDIRVIKQNGKYYLDFNKYDYSDLLEH